MKLQAQSVLGGAYGTPSPVGKFRSAQAILSERSDMGCVLLSVAVDSEEVVAAASRACGVELPLCAGAVRALPETTGGIVFWLTARSWLIHCDPALEAELLGRIAESFPDKLAHGVSLTDAVCWMELSGPASLDLLTEGGFVSLERGGLPVRHAKRTLIAQVGVVLVHRAEDRWLIGVERSRARYLVRWLSGAAEARG